MPWLRGAGPSAAGTWRAERWRDPFPSHESKPVRSHLSPPSGLSEHFASGTRGVVDIAGWLCVCFSSFYFAGLASSPRQKTYLHLSPQSRLFAGTLCGGGPALCDTNPCMSLPVSVRSPRPALPGAGGAWAPAAACIESESRRPPPTRPALPPGAPKATSVRKSMSLGPQAWSSFTSRVTVGLEKVTASCPVGSV